jgi:hypothetical protein
MSDVLWTVVSLVAYAGGLVILVKVTPLLLSHSYDDGLFMVIAAGDVFGGLFVFGAVALTFALFSGSFAIRVLDFLLLGGIIIVNARLSYYSFRPRRTTTFRRVSRIVAGAYCLFLLLAAFYYIVLLFTPIG